MGLIGSKFRFTWKDEGVEKLAPFRNFLLRNYDTYAGAWRYLTRDVNMEKSRGQQNFLAMIEKTLHNIENGIYRLVGSDDYDDDGDDGEEADDKKDDEKDQLAPMEANTSLASVDEDMPLIDTTASRGSTDTPPPRGSLASVAAPGAGVG